MNGVGEENGDCEDEGIDPGMAEGEVLPAAEVGAGFSSLEMLAGNFALGIALSWSR